ncbi:uncharacterized protein LY89DRAFT_781157 [Mollisia scopiformis]|uniref:Uncharacterized protein n=1 Tax=Mollisia scopiformis TaxID=149040 RepID=A0A194XD25_MOLSC|nr:uncharacterized protein LY89DRAFT_781157 [Mollisia scopiformis]KUJ18059.1 hypothetical protein LY89DRAFT_781157 [Mollisia scopiformis]
MRSLLLTIIILSLSNLTFASRRVSPRTALLVSPSPSSKSTSISTATIPTKVPADADEAFLTAAKSTVTPAPAVIIDADGKVQGVEEKWHLTTFTSCHTFDATFTYCGLHEPVLPGGDEIAGAVRPLDARGGVLRAVVVLLGTLVGLMCF